MDNYYKEEDLVRYIQKHGKIDMHDMRELWKTSISEIPHYLIYDCTTINGSCGDILVFPIRHNKTQ